MYLVITTICVTPLQNVALTVSTTVFMTMDMMLEYLWHEILTYQPAACSQVMLYPTLYITLNLQHKFVKFVRLAVL